MANTGDHGGQCVEYAKNTLKPTSEISGNANTWYENTTYCRKTSVMNKCAACWSGGEYKLGHVGVVETWNNTTKKMKYSDSNFVPNKELVIVRDNISEDEMKKLFGDSYKFQGYVELK